MKYLILLILLAAGCVTKLNDDSYTGEGTFDPDRPEDPGDRTVAPYTGGNADVLDAQARMYTGHDMHDKVIRRACSGINGVCHNQQEYPDMRTAATFLETISQPCNLNAKYFSTVYNRCEVPGDTVAFNNAEYAPIEIAYIDWRKGEHTGGTPNDSSLGLHVYLRDPIPLELGNRYRTLNISRRLNQGGTIEEVVFTQHRGNWWVVSPTHLMAEVPTNEAQQVESWLGVGIRQGDANRDGTFGADNGNVIGLIEPGKPDESYLISRLTGHMQGDPIPGTRMPLANIPPTVPEMLALVCFVEGLPTDGSPASMSWPIDYRNCSYSANPDLLTLTGTGTATWATSVRPILQANCGGCHGGANPLAGLDLAKADSYSELMKQSLQQPNLKLVEPNDPQSSYLWLKLQNAASITGGGMPQDPQTGYRPLDSSELSAIETWINNGALEN